MLYANMHMQARKDFLSDVKRYGKYIALAVLWDLENYDIEKLGEQERNKKIAKLINAQKITK